MEPFDFATQLRDKAEGLGWLFIMGPQDYANAAHKINDELTEGQRVLWVDLSSSSTRGYAGILQSINYTGSIVLLGKFDDGGLTESNMDEDTEQKYDRRLKDLNQELSTFLGEIICAENLRSVSESYDYIQNLFDTNLDGVICQPVITQTDFDEPTS